MKKARVMSLSKDGDGLPIVEGALDVSEQTPGLYIAYGDPVPYSNGKGSSRGPEQVHAYLVEHDTDEYVVVAEEVDFLEIDALDKGERPQDVRPRYRFYSMDGTAPDPETGEPVSFKGRRHAFGKGNIPVLPPTAQAPWVVDDMTVTDMRPSLPSAFSDEMYAAVENEAL